jgi:hypothetical protein
MRDNLYDSLDQVKIRLPNHLSDQVSPINSFSQSSAEFSQIQTHNLIRF